LFLFIPGGMNEQKLLSQYVKELQDFKSLAVMCVDLNHLRCPSATSLYHYSP